MDEFQLKKIRSKTRENTIVEMETTRENTIVEMETTRDVSTIMEMETTRDNHSAKTSILPVTFSKG